MNADWFGLPRWRGQPDRVEVWYTTFTDTEGTGYWLHYETVSPVAGDAYAHGWAAVFQPDAPARVERFGPSPVAAGHDAWFVTSDASFEPGRMSGSAGGLAWDLRFADASAPVFTFPRSVWDHELLPAAQIVPWPCAEVHGSFSIDGTPADITATGAVARIYGHGNAQRWCWLHADLGDGALLELVAAAPRHLARGRLPMVPLVQLRMPGRVDWPRRPLVAAAAFRAQQGHHGFVVRGALGRRRLSVAVSLPREQSVTLSYKDPDGATASCTNSERANAHVMVERWAGRWMREHAWHVSGTAHAEFGRRP